ncbi:MAG: hypothetical protein ACI9TY_000345 [Alphaproteobacteria bacterium]
MTAMKSIENKQALENELTTLDVVDSLAVTFIHGSLDVQTIIAIRNADRLCDRVVVVNLSNTNFSDAQKSIVKRAGGSYFYQGENTQGKCILDVDIQGINGTFIMQTLIIIMPLTVTVAENNTHLIKALKNIQQTFGEFFALQIKATPIHLLSIAHRKLRENLTPILLDIQDGENDVEILSAGCTSSLKGAGFKIERLSFIDSDTLNEHVGVISPTSLLLVEATLNGQSVKDILSLIEK